MKLAKATYLFADLCNVVISGVLIAGMGVAVTTVFGFAVTAVVTGKTLRLVGILARPFGY